MKTVFISGCTGSGSGGIYRCVVDGEGRIIPKEKTVLSLPMYTAVAKGKLFALLREPFWGVSKNSGIVSFDIDGDGRLSNKSDIYQTDGIVACHLSVSSDAKDIYVVNYLSGNVLKIGSKPVVHEGHGVDPRRQEAPHTHMALLTPDERYVLVNDLGIDRMFFYTRDMQLVSTVKFPDGKGPRHAVFSNDGRYIFCVNELTSDVTVLEYVLGTAKIIHEGYPALPDGFKGKNTAAAIRLSVDGKYLYVSNRGHDSIAVFDVERDRLLNPEFVYCGGKSPRDINICGDFMLCANEGSDKVTSLRICGKKLLPTGHFFCAPRPLCITVM